MYWLQPHSFRTSSISTPQQHKAKSQYCASCPVVKHAFLRRSGDPTLSLHQGELFRNQKDKLTGVHAVASARFGHRYWKMDAVSLTASVIALIQLAGSCLKLSRRFVGPSEYGSSDLDSMVTALYGFTGALKTFQTHLEIYEDDEARLTSLEYLKPALKQCEEALNIIKDFVEKSNFIGKHFTGPKFDRKLKISLKALDGAKELLILALHADQQ